MRRALLAPLAVVAVLAGCGSSGERLGTLVYMRGVDPAKTTIWIARGDGGHARPLVQGVNPVVSPDGRWVAFARCAKRACEDVYVVRTKGGEPEPVFVAEEAYGIEWSPDSKRILTSTGGSFETLVTIDVRTRKRVDLARGFFRGFSYSPSGSEVVYSQGGRDCDRRHDLYVVSSRGGKARRLTRGWRSVYPVWGSKAIAFARDSGLCYPSTYRVWRIDPGGRNARLLTPGRISHSEGSWGWVPADWSADGHRLLAYRTSEFYDQPYAVDPVAGVARAIGGRQRNYYTARMSRDGKLVLLEGDRCFDSPECGQVVVLPYYGGRLQVLATEGLSPDWNR